DRLGIVTATVGQIEDRVQPRDAQRRPAHGSPRGVRPVGLPMNCGGIGAFSGSGSVSVSSSPEPSSSSQSSSQPSPALAGGPSSPSRGGSDGSEPPSGGLAICFWKLTLSVSSPRPLGLG